MYAVVENSLRIHFENLGQCVELHGIQWFDNDQKKMWCICAQGLLSAASNTSPNLKDLVTCKNGHGSEDGDAGTAHRGAEEKFIPRRTDGGAKLIC